MNPVSEAILIVLFALQPPQPAAAIVSEDESLLGVSAMSVSVQVQGKLIDAAATSIVIGQPVPGRC